MELKKLPYTVNGCVAYTTEEFDRNPVLTKYRVAIENAMNDVHKKRMNIGALLIFKYWVVALPPSDYSMHLIGKACINDVYED